MKLNFLPGRNKQTKKTVIADKNHLHTHIYNIVIYAVMASVLLACQVALSFLPNIELVTTLIIVYTLCIGIKAFYPVAVFVLLQGIIYGFGLWFINYCYIWLILVLLVLLYKKLIARDNPFFLVFTSLFSAFYGLIFGSLCSIPYFFIGGVNMVIAYIAAGLVFDILHCIGNFFVTFILLLPILKVCDMVFSNKRWR